jgi:hypothetical protein
LNTAILEIAPSQFCERKAPAIQKIRDRACLKNIAKVLRPTTFSGPRPFSFQAFLTRSPPSPYAMAEAEKKARLSGEQTSPPTNASILPTTEKSQAASPAKSSLHPAYYIVAWIGFSGGVILFNKWVLDTLKFSM